MCTMYPDTRIYVHPSIDTAEKPIEALPKTCGYLLLLCEFTYYYYIVVFYCVFPFELSLSSISWLVSRLSSLSFALAYTIHNSIYCVLFFVYVEISAFIIMSSSADEKEKKGIGNEKEITETLIILNSLWKYLAFCMCVLCEYDATSAIVSLFLDYLRSHDFSTNLLGFDLWVTCKKCARHSRESDIYCVRAMAAITPRFICARL